MTTLTQFVSGLASLPVAGVVRQYTAPPASLSTSDLPASWTQLPSGERGVASYRPSEFNWRAYRAQLIVATQPFAQDTQEANYADVLAMVDAVMDALQNADICAGPLQWSVHVGVVTVAGVQYWAVIADVEGNG